MKRLFETVTVNNMQAIVRGKNECGEYVVSLYVLATWRAIESKGARYFTDDLEDACRTACAMVSR